LTTQLMPVKCSPKWLEFLQNVYSCRKCAEEGRSFVDQFDEARPGLFYKFPPLIGHIGKVKLLFVGYNPRRTSNLAIHNFAMEKFTNFCTLSENTNHLGDRYIGSSSTAPDHENHYDLHNGIVQRVFAKPFTEVAAATEMYLCASKNGGKLNTENSPCAQTFLLRTIRISDPDYILTFGSGLPRFFRDYVSGVRANVIPLPYPSWRTPQPTMTAAVDWAVDSLIALEAGKQPPQKSWKWPSSDNILPQGIMRYP
jgi:hypothetical protein